MAPTVGDLKVFNTGFWGTGFWGTGFWDTGFVSVSQGIPDGCDQPRQIEQPDRGVRSTTVDRKTTATPGVAPKPTPCHN
ncbi:hypothetical protein [Prochlorothrix hollandica]|uniref:Uncharacterized protein n=1 Tax=Prochlorothrix hollandica PCC 9006 = CALU 1027 TaxID=317619 RepID=A0A0M2PVH0_PROHO|nr:hypothetical protein PROH_10595 [Prochlorothrix hollandica PCC 9006 = CALU 1027]